MIQQGPYTVEFELKDTRFADRLMGAISEAGITLDHLGQQNASFEFSKQDVF